MVFHRLPQYLDGSQLRSICARLSLGVRARPLCGHITVRTVVDLGVQNLLSMFPTDNHGVRSWSVDDTKTPSGEASLGTLCW